jgi:hypothetical protein
MGDIFGKNIDNIVKRDLLSKKELKVKSDFDDTKVNIINRLSNNILM